eukprot:TRINITY_DN1485_c0_g1_i1.p1 TRINITY_DN1485_c0_g1~~TRINITY_DN1485_c0_g1_i1.p1  ORF type:complete len:594 (+),score=129.44 TRINITY_DN1485_c0_g1_i1:105-1886(+)
MERSLSLARFGTKVVLTTNKEYTLPSLVITPDTNAPHSCTLRCDQVSLAGPDEVYDTPIFGVVGIIQLLAGPYLIVMTKIESVGTILGNQVFRIKEVDTVRVDLSTPLNEAQKKDEVRYQSLIKTVLLTGSFYYSYTYDLTHSMQEKEELINKGALDLSAPVWNRVNKRYVWNHHLQQPFIEYQSQFGEWFPPIIQGFIGIKDDCVVNDHRFSFILVSRRSTKRAGTRFITRGSDLEGNVANAVETEQILVFNDNTTNSFLQMRGSIPVVWRQVVNLSYEPPIEIDESSSSLPVKLHFEEQYKIYKKQCILNLLKHEGSESKLSKLFASEVEKLKDPNIRFVSFDVHKECKLTDFSKLSKLTDMIIQERKEFAYFTRNSAGIPVKFQKGIFRTNCKDCLDRTNLVQGVVARMSLVDQLTELKIVKNEEDLVSNKNFMHFFRCVWADNGDAISEFYAGTGAIRGDVTRNGKQTLQGLINDGVNSVSRYYLNNMQDGNKQNGIDLLLNKYQVSRAVKSPFAENSNDMMGVFVSFLLSIFYVYAPMQIRYKSSLIVIALCLFIFVFLNKIARVSSKKIVSHAKLVDHNSHVKLPPK